MTFGEQTLLPYCISDKIRIFEILAVLMTGIGKFIFMDILNWKLLFIIMASVGWSTYIAYRCSHTKGILHYWGFRTDNLKRVTLQVLPFGVGSVSIFFVVGYLQDSIHLTWHILPILLIYPVWGTIQQFLIIGLVAGNLQDLHSFSVHKMTILILTAFLFAGVHFPNYWLMLATFVLALFYGYVYLKARNVYVLGMYHGWLGGLFFYTVVGRDPFQEIFGESL